MRFPRRSSLLALALVFAGCSDATDTDTEPDTETDSETDTDTGSDTDVTTAECSGWSLLTEFYPDVSLDDLGPCDEQGAVVAESLMNFEGLTITGDSVVADDGSNTLQPCVEALCDDVYVYIASNAVPNYSPQAQPIFDTVDVPIVHRIPLEPMAIDTSVAADDWLNPQGCDAALGMALTNTTPEMPPSSHCWYETEDGTANTGELYISDGTSTVQKVHCYGQTGTVITGIPTFAPNEEARPDPYGTPLFSTYQDTGSPFVDFCGTHPAAITHNHWINEVCLEQDADNKPANSYVTGADAFVVEDLDAANCTEESDTVGWVYDGHPMMGSCVCMQRDNDGSCTDLRRARSSYLYTGLTTWTDDANTEQDIGSDTVAASSLSNELATCTVDTDCCAADDQECRLLCHPLLVEGTDGDVQLEDRCVTPDYSWCTHSFSEHTNNLEDDGYVYLDRCNGVQTADGYRYVGTITFPYVNSCYTDQPTAMATDDTYIRLDVGDGPGGPGGPPGP